MILISYDIEKNRTRTRLSKFLEKEGLERVHKSVFIGDPDNLVPDDLAEKLSTFTDVEKRKGCTDTILVIYLNGKAIETLQFIGHKPQLMFIPIAKRVQIL